MQYMGGKSRIARSIAEIINEIPRRKIKNCQTHCSDNHAGCGGGIALSAYFAAVVPWKARCKVFPANSSMTGTNTSLQCSKAFNKAITCRSVIDKAIAEQAAGAGLILWTCREGELLQQALDACAQWGLHFDAVNESLPSWIAAFGTRPRKVGASEYWDDRAVVVRDGEVQL